MLSFQSFFCLEVRNICEASAQTGQCGIEKEEKKDKDLSRNLVCHRNYSYMSFATKLRDGNVKEISQRKKSKESASFLQRNLLLNLLSRLKSHSHFYAIDRTSSDRVLSLSACITLSPIDSVQLKS
jgi:hypothetical protein